MATKKEKSAALAPAAETEELSAAANGEGSSGGKAAFTYKPYTPSQEVKQAQAQLQQQQEARPGAYASGWQSQLEGILDKLQNREKFSYDLSGDALYRQYKDAYTRQGKLAMLDTMGQAAALTGGYGNSYAQNAGQQAYQSYLQKLSDQIPELYQLALSRYDREGEDLRSQASLLADMEQQDYSRYRDRVTDYNTQLDRLTQDARYREQQDYSRWQDQLDMDYDLYRDTVADERWQAEFDEALRQYEQSQSKSGGGSGKTATVYKSLTHSDRQLMMREIAACSTTEEVLGLAGLYAAQGYAPDVIAMLTESKLQSLQAARLPAIDTRKNQKPASGFSPAAKQ